MNCNKCGFPLTQEDRFCKNCGAAVNTQNAQSNQNINMMNNGGFNLNNGMNNMPNNGGYNMPMQQSNIPIANPKDKKDNTMMYAVVGAIVVVVVVILVLLVPKYLKNDNSEANTGNTTSTDTSGTSTSTGTNVGSNTTTTSVYKVSYSGFTLSIPDNYEYSISNGYLNVGDDEGTWIAQLYVMDGSYSQLKTNKAQIVSYAEQSGATAKAAEVKTLGGTEFITVESYENGINYIVGYAKLNSSKILCIATYNQDNSIDYTQLENISTIIKSAVYNDSTNSISVDNYFNFSTYGIKDLAQ